MMISTRSFAGAALAVALLIASAHQATAQDLHPSRRPSPLGVAKTTLGNTYLKITYSRPYMRGRAVFGDSSDGTEYLVPYGAMWRTGANEATELTVTGPVLIAGQRLEAGTYSVFTVPGPRAWSIRFNRQLGMDGTGRLDAMSGEFSETYDEADDVLVVEVSSGNLDEEVDQFTIAFAGTGSSADMVLSWELTEVRIPVQVTEK